MEKRRGRREVRRGENEGKRRRGSKKVGELEERGQAPVVDTGSLSWATSQPWTDNKVILSQNEACRFIEQVLLFPLPNQARVACVTFQILLSLNRAGTYSGFPACL